MSPMSFTYLGKRSSDLLQHTHQGRVAGDPRTRCVGAVTIQGSASSSMSSAMDDGCTKTSIGYWVRYCAHVLALVKRL